MADPTPTADVRPNETAGHLSVRVEGQHPAEIPFLFEQSQKRLATSVVAALVSPVAFGLFIIVLIRNSSAANNVAAVLPEQPPSTIVWLNEPGPRGGGGRRRHKIKA